MILKHFLRKQNLIIEGVLHEGTLVFLTISCVKSEILAMPCGSIYLVNFARHYAFYSGWCVRLCLIIKIYTGCYIMLSRCDFGVYQILCTKRILLRIQFFPELHHVNQIFHTTISQPANYIISKNH